MVDYCLKPNGTFITFCQQPFTSQLINSNVNTGFNIFKYMMYWRKQRPSGFVNAKLKPLKDIEEIAVFSKGTTANCSKNNMIYNPQGLTKVDKQWKRPKTYGTGKGVNPTRRSHLLERTIEFEGYPRQVLDFSMHNGKQIHETQKPVDLMEYLIKTYSNEFDFVLDPCAGSASTLIACENLNRNYFGYEKDPQIFEKAQKRLAEHISRGVGAECGVASETVENKDFPQLLGDRKLF
jgi:site-specific DNA-methyltransferase (adenine-specific)